MPAKIRILILADNEVAAASLLGPELVNNKGVEFTWVASQADFKNVLILGGFWDVIVSPTMGQLVEAREVIRILKLENKLHLPVIVLAQPYDIDESIGYLNDGAFRYIPCGRQDILWQCIQAAVAETAQRPRRFQSDNGLKQAESGGEEGQSRLKVVFDESPVGIVISDLSGRPLQTNRAFLEMFGYAEGELWEMRFLDASYPEDIERHLALVREAFEGKRSGFSIDKRYFRKNGEIFWARLNVSLVKSDRGAIEFIISMLEDITRQKEVEEALRQSEERYRTLAEAAHDMIFVIGKNDEVIYVNSYASHFVDPPECKIIDQPRQLMFPQEIAERQGKNLRKVFETGRELYVESLTPFSKGDVWLGTWLVPIRNGQDEITSVLGVARDITQQKKAEEKLKAAYEKEKELGELKSMFVSRTSHEFRTPLSTILSSAELLEYYGKDWPEQKKAYHFHRIQNTVKEMTRLLEDIMIIERVEAGRLTCHPSSMNLAEFFSNAIEDARLGDRDSHKFIFSSNGNFADAAMDEHLLRQVFMNILSNAIKYSERNTTIHILLERLDTRCVLTVKDQGIGISAEDRRHLFERFYRGKNVGAVSGTGLGLAIVKESVLLMQGEIKVNSCLGQGTEIRVTLPVVQTSFPLEDR